MQKGKKHKYIIPAIMILIVIILVVTDSILTKIRNSEEESIITDKSISLSEYMD